MSLRAILKRMSSRTLSETSLFDHDSNIEFISVIVYDEPGLRCRDFADKDRNVRENLCDELLHSKEEFFAHVKKRHRHLFTKKPLDRQLEKLTTQCLYHCAVCRKSIKQMRSLNNHLRKTHGLEWKIGPNHHQRTMNTHINNENVHTPGKSTFGRGNAGGGEHSGDNSSCDSSLSGGPRSSSQLSNATLPVVQSAYFNFLDDIAPQTYTDSNQPVLTGGIFATLNGTEICNFPLNQQVPATKITAAKEEQILEIPRYPPIKIIARKDLIEIRCEAKMGFSAEPQIFPTTFTPKLSRDMSSTYSCDGELPTNSGIMKNDEPPSKAMSPDASKSVTTVVDETSIGGGELDGKFPHSLGGPESDATLLDANMPPHVFEMPLFPNIEMTINYDCFTICVRKGMDFEINIANSEPTF
jgi:uncharacterized C2H2 Zn-finger protein